MRTVDEHREAILAGIDALAPIELPLETAHGCVLAEDVVASWPLPSFDNASMDGYAVRHDDIEEASADLPVSLRVVDDVPAGFRASHAVEPGTAVRIMTGAPIPDGTDSVVPVELTDGAIDDVVIHRPVARGANIRRAGEDVALGEVVLESGTPIASRQLAILAAVGRAAALVRPRPRVAVISTGSELVEPGRPLRHGLISDSNSYLLVAAAREAGADAHRVGPVLDEDDAFLAAVEDQLHRCDLILTSGGVSMGAYDTVKAVLSRLGTVEFTTVAMNPGKPQGHGVVGEDGDRVPIITLPGNPVSAYVSFEAFVRPVILRMRGFVDVERPVMVARSVVGFDSPPGKRQFARARFVGDAAVAPTGRGQGSHVLGGLAMAEALIVVPENVTRVEAGDDVSVWDLRRP